MYTLYVLVRSLDADGELEFRNFRLREISQGNRGALDEVRKLLKTEDVSYGEWLLSREYEHVPPATGQNPGRVGRIPLDAEDILLLLRLFRPGDLYFVRLGILRPDGVCQIQSPYRIIGSTADHSVFPYTFRQEECESWDAFADNLVDSPAWASTWFATARRFFLYGGAKEFNPLWDEVDRLVDYVTALEAALVPERDFVGARLRHRAASSIRPHEDERTAVTRKIRDLYEFRSSIVHGTPMSTEDRNSLAETWRDFEALVREILVVVVQTLPADDAERTRFLQGVYDVTDQLRADAIRQGSQAISDDQVRAQLARDLAL